MATLLTGCSTGAESPVGSSTTGAPTATTAAPRGEIDIQGHRGARGLKPENTLPSFEAALDLLVTTLELDMHFSLDGVPVIWHDPVVHRDKCRLDANAVIDAPDPDVADESELAIAALTVEQLGAYQCDRNPDPGRFPEQTDDATQLAGADYRIIPLAELFEFVDRYASADDKTSEQRSNAAGVQFNIETKRDPDIPETINDGFDGENAGAFELAVIAAVEDANLVDRVTVQSFDHRSLRAARAAEPRLQIAALTRRNEAFDPEFATFADIWSPDYRSLSADSIGAAHEAGLLVIPWTVNDSDDMTRLIGLGVDGLISDRPDLAMRATGRDES